MPKTITKTIEAFTARELQELHPRGFERAYYKHLEFLDFDIDYHIEHLRTLLDCVNYSLNGKSVSYCIGDRSEHLKFDCIGTPKVIDITALKGETGDETIIKCAESLNVRINECRVFGLDLDRFDNYYQTTSVCNYRDTNRYDISCDLEGIESDSELVTACENVQDTTAELLDAICRLIFKNMDSDYEYRTSEECFIEESETNEWYYDIIGNFINE